MTISRIANFATNTQLINFLLRTQKRMMDTQVQLSSEKVSQNYAGISLESERLINIENSALLLDRYKSNNELVDVKMKIMETTIGGIKGAIRDFRAALFDFSSGGANVEARVETIQKAAFRALKDMEAYLNTDAGGEYLFSGARTGTQPANFNLTDLATFQATYDGSAVLYPVTRDAHVLTSLTTANANTGDLTFATAGDTITAATAGSLSSIPVGAKITVAGAAAGNNKDYTVVSNTGTVITVTGNMTVGASTIAVSNSIATDEIVAATISVSHYYNGDNVVQSHRVSKIQSFDFDVNAIDPAFEKAIRAMGIIAQGDFGTAGGLDSNSTRIDDALSLLKLSLNPPATTTQPYGTELASNIEELEMDHGYKRVLIDRNNQNHETLIGFLEAQVAAVENIDTLDAVIRLLDDSQALEASYQALARIRQLSLSNFL